MTGYFDGACSLTLGKSSRFGLDFGSAESNHQYWFKEKWSYAVYPQKSKEFQNEFKECELRLNNGMI